MMKNTIITFLLIVIVVLLSLLYKSKHEYNEAQKLITEIKQNLDEAKEELKAKTSIIKQDLNETGNMIEEQAKKIKSDLKAK